MVRRRPASNQTAALFEQGERSLVDTRLGIDDLRSGVETRSRDRIGG